MKYVYGPVPSRRLGRSLGVDTIPPKTCNFSCVFCQLGQTTTFINSRKDFFPPDEILQELRQRVIAIGEKHVDYITFVGDGEPTLCRSLGWLINHVKSEFSIPVAVLTNGAILYNKRIREELLAADIILPSLDAGFPKTFKKINRPHPSIHFDRLIEGMIKFSNVYSGQLWLEFMAVRGLNDTKVELNQICSYLDLIKPDRVYINVPIRPPAERWVLPPTPRGLARIQEILKGGFELIHPESGEFKILNKDISELKEEITQIVKRHPMRMDQIEDLLKDMNVEEPEKIILDLEKEGLINRLIYQNKIFFTSAELKIRKK